MTDKSGSSPRTLLDESGRLVIVGPTERATIARGFWAKGMDVVHESLDTAARLREAGFPSAAYVWAVRSVEIFFRQCVALCSYYDEGEDVLAAIDRATKFVGNGNWSRVWSLVDSLVEEIPLTDTDEDAWAHWKRHAVSTRGDVVHGRREVGDADAQWAIQYAERIVSWVTQRLAVADRGPLRGLLRDLIVAMQELASEEAESTPQEDCDDDP